MLPNDDQHSRIIPNEAEHPTTVAKQHGWREPQWSSPTASFSTKSFCTGVRAAFVIAKWYATWSESTLLVDPIINDFGESLVADAAAHSRIWFGWTGAGGVARRVFQRFFVEEGTATEFVSRWTFDVYVFLVRYRSSILEA